MSDLDDQELEATRNLYGVGKLSRYRTYLNSLDNIQIMLDGLPNLDERSAEFYSEMYDLIDDEIDRVEGLLHKEELKLLKK